MFSSLRDETVISFCLILGENKSNEVLSQMILAAGCIPVLASNVYLDNDDSKDTLMISLDILSEFFQKESLNKYDLSMSLIRQGIFERISIIFDNLQQFKSHPYSKWFGKAIQLVYKISWVNSARIKNALWNSKLWDNLIYFLNSVSDLSMDSTSLIVKILKNAIQKDKTVDKLYKKGAIQALKHLYWMWTEEILKITSSISSGMNPMEFDQVLNTYKTMVGSVLRQMLEYCRALPSLSFKIIESDFVKPAYNTDDSNKIHVIELLLFMIKTSEKCRTFMWNAVQGPNLLLAQADKTNHKGIVKIYEALVIWLNIDVKGIVDFLSSGETIQSFLKLAFQDISILSVQQYSDILPLVKEIIKISPDLAKKISRRKAIILNLKGQINGIISCKEFERDLSKGHSSDMSSKNSQQFYSQPSSHKGMHASPYNHQGEKNYVWALQEILEIIILIIEQAKHSHKEFIGFYEMGEVIKNTLHIAKSQNLLQIKELWKQLRS